MKKIITVAMSEHDARQTAGALGAQYSAFGVTVNDADGYIDDMATALNWYVEQDDSIVPDHIFGYTWESIQNRQRKK